MGKSFVIQGNICQTIHPKELDLHENAFAVCVDGISKGVFDTLPEEYTSLPLYDYKDALIFPGMVDLHVHAPQYAFRGMCMDLELMDWLNRYTFPEEEKYEDLEKSLHLHHLPPPCHGTSDETDGRTAPDPDGIRHSCSVPFVGKQGRNRFCEVSASRKSLLWGFL